jgi:ribosomal protein S18 acetylase RimI-like enzyme
MVEIEPAQEDEVEEIVKELWYNLAREREGDHKYNELAEDGLIENSVSHKRGVVNREDSEIYTAKDEDEIVGYISFSISERPPVFKIKKKLSVSELFVKESHRGKSIGKKLIEKAQKYAEDNGCKFMSLSVDLPNEEAYGFYQHLGFERYRRKLAKDL